MPTSVAAATPRLQSLQVGELIYLNIRVICLFYFTSSASKGSTSRALGTDRTKKHQNIFGSELSLSVFVVRRKVVDLGCQTRFHGAPYQHYCCDGTDPRPTRARPRSSRSTQQNENPVTLHGSELEEVKAFTYLGSITDKQSSTYADVRARTDKAREAYLQLRNIWSSKVVSTRTKIRLFNSNVKSVLLYGAETWRTNEDHHQESSKTFINSCLRRILQMR